MSAGLARAPDWFQERVHVSRETIHRLERYAALLIEWQARFNLIGPASLPELWTRHFLDSAQLLSLIPPDAKRLIDIGSGAGFPALALAILLMDRPGFEVVLIESTQKKCRFLETVISETGAPARVHCGRAETAALPKADVITARACASLRELLDYAVRFVGRQTVCLFPKGRSFQDELTDACRFWKMRYDLVDSQTDPQSRIIVIRSLTRVSR